MNDKLLKELAINGGPKAVPNPLPPRGHFGAEEKAAANRIIDEAIAKGVAPGYGGPEEEIFCKEFSEMMGGGYADAVNGGTTAVYVALRALEPEPFSEVVVGPITDPGGIMPIVMCNCIPVVADAYPGSFNTNLEAVKKVVTNRTSVIIIPHIAGEPAEIDKICEFAKSKGIKVVEDAAQAHGAKLNGKLVGTFGDIAAYSMMFGKHTCMGGQGGVVFTKSEDLYWKVRQYSDRGKPFGLPAGSTNCVASLNFNGDELGCAIGREQIKKTASIAAGRRRVIKKIFSEISEVKALVQPEFIPGSDPSFWFWRLHFDGSVVDCTKQEFGKAVAAECNMNVLPDYPGLPFTFDWFQNQRAFGTGHFPWSAPQNISGNHITTLADLPVAKQSIDETILFYPLESWSDTDCVNVANAIKKVYNAYKK